MNEVEGPNDPRRLGFGSSSDPMGHALVASFRFPSNNPAPRSADRASTLVLIMRKKMTSAPPTGKTLELRLHINIL